MAPNTSFLLPQHHQRRTMMSSLLDPIGSGAATAGVAHHLAAAGLSVYDVVVPPVTSRYLLPILAPSPSSATANPGIHVTTLLQKRPVVKKQRTGVYYNNCEIFHEMHPVQLRYANRYTSVVPSLPAGNPMPQPPTLAATLPQINDSKDDRDSTDKTVVTCYHPNGTENEETSSTTIDGDSTSLGNKMSTSKKRALSETEADDEAVERDEGTKEPALKSRRMSHDREDVRTPPLLNDRDVVIADESKPKESLSSEQRVFLEAAMALSGLGNSKSSSTTSSSKKENDSKRRNEGDVVSAVVVAAVTETISSKATTSPRSVVGCLPPPPFFIPSAPKLGIRSASPKRWMTN